MTSQKQADKPKKPTEPGSLENKFGLMIRFAFDRRVGRKHMLVYGFILDWWHRRYGDALASVRHIVSELKMRDPNARGLYMGDVHSALADLVDWGYLIQEKGKGRRASRYVPVWSLDPSVRAIPNASEETDSVLEAPNADVRTIPNATADSVQQSQNEDPSTRDPVTRPGEREIDGLTDTPLASAGAAAPPTPGADAFNELWLAYGVRKDRKAARAAYQAICPTPEQHAVMLAAAEAWKVGAGTIQRMGLATWLKDERWMEDAPRPYQRPEKPIQAATRAATPANDNNPATPPTRRVATSQNVRVSAATPYNDGTVGGEAGIRLEVYHLDGYHAGHRDIIDLTLSNPWRPKLEERGQLAFAQICAAVSIVEAPERADVFLEKTFTIHTDEDGHTSYHPLGTPLPTVAVA